MVNRKKPLRKINPFRRLLPIFIIVGILGASVYIATQLSSRQGISPNAPESKPAASSCSGTCRSDCREGEKGSGIKCDNGQYCCIKTSTNDKKTGSASTNTNSSDPSCSGTCRSDCREGEKGSGIKCKDGLYCCISTDPIPTVTTSSSKTCDSTTSNPICKGQPIGYIYQCNRNTNLGFKCVRNYTDTNMSCAAIEVDCNGVAITPTSSASPTTTVAPTIVTPAVIVPTVAPTLPPCPDIVSCEPRNSVITTYHCSYNSQGIPVHLGSNITTDNCQYGCADSTSCNEGGCGSNGINYRYVCTNDYLTTYYCKKSLFSKTGTWVYYSSSLCEDGCNNATNFCY